jgi:hypothetical protein
MWYAATFLTSEYSNADGRSIGCRKVTVEPSELYLGDGSKFTNSSQPFALSTSEPENLPLPSAFLLNLHHRLATALHDFIIVDQASNGWPPRESQGESQVLS